jgi:hypothetical protein
LISTASVSSNRPRCSAMSSPWKPSSIGETPRPTPSWKRPFDSASSIATSSTSRMGL